MEIFYAYLKPENELARTVVQVMWGLCALWVALLISSLVRHLVCRSQILKNRDAGEVLRSTTTFYRDAAEANGNESAVPSANECRTVFQNFLDKKSLLPSSPIAQHLRAIFEAGWNESRLEAHTLIKNTSDDLFRTNALLRSTLSVFIILGVLGTLIGLADTVSKLGEVLSSTAQMNDATIKYSGEVFGKLKSAFAPSILGVFLTVLGVLILSLYLRFVAMPLAVLLERVTITVWMPQLLPTASQRLDTHVRETYAAARQVADFAKEIRQKTGSLNKALGQAGERLTQMTDSAGKLQSFSENFVAGVDRLVPFQQELRALYEQMVAESRAFQESVQRNIAGSQEFQNQIQQQLNGQHEQLAQVLMALGSYESAYVTNRERIDEKLQEVLAQAKLAFESLSRRNEEIAVALDESVGKPIREKLGESLGGVQTELRQQLGDISMGLQTQLRSITQQLGALDGPINKAAGALSDTFANFNENTRGWLDNVRREFATQNQTNQQQLQHIVVLSKNVPALVDGLTTSSTRFTETSGRFADQGTQLNDSVMALSGNIVALREAMQSLGERVSRIEPAAHPESSAHVMALLEKQSAVLQRIEARVAPSGIPQTPLSAKHHPDIVIERADGARAATPPRRGWRARWRRLFAREA